MIKAGQSDANHSSNEDNIPKQTPKKCFVSAYPMCSQEHHAFFIFTSSKICWFNAVNSSVFHEFKLRLLISEEEWTCNLPLHVSEKATTCIRAQNISLWWTGWAVLLLQLPICRRLVYVYTMRQRVRQRLLFKHPCSKKMFAMYFISKNRERLLSVPSAYAGNVCSGLCPACAANVYCLLHQHLKQTCNVCFSNCRYTRITRSEI